MARETTITFAMHGARGAIASGLTHIEQQVTALERAVIENPGYAFDLAKTLIESTCCTILAERGVSYDKDDKLPKLFKAASNTLPFLPSSASGSIEARKSLAQTLGGLSAAVQGVCELRNACGFASHGSDRPRPALESVQALLAAEAADTIVGFFYSVHQQDRTPAQLTTRVQDRDSEFDAYIDDQHPTVQIFEEDFAASKILFELAPEPYRLYLDEYRFDQQSSSQSEQWEDTVVDVRALREEQS
jgi:cytochrome P450